MKMTERGNYNRQEVSLPSCVEISKGKVSYCSS